MYADLTFSSKAVQYANVLENIFWNKGQKTSRNGRLLWIIFFQYFSLSSSSNRVNLSVQFSSVQFSSVTQSGLFVTPWAAAHQPSLSFTISQSLVKLMCIESTMPHNRLILCCSFSSWLQSFPASGSFPVSRLFASGSQSIGASASASVLPINIQG